jgi:hypothetical protein
MVVGSVTALVLAFSVSIDTTIEDPKAYTKTFTVRVDQRILPEEELIEFVCNENQQFRRRIKID